MNALLVISALLVPEIQAKILPRQALQTIEVPLPTQGLPFTSTIQGCGTVKPIAIVGVPTGTFVPGNFTIYGPPQASPSGTTIYDDKSNASEVLTFIPLKGTCAEFPVPEQTPTGSITGGPPAASSPAPQCPEDGCSGKVIKTAQIVIDAINQVTLLSQGLQSAAKRIGESISKRDTGATNTILDDVAIGLTDISVTLTVLGPRIAFLPPFPPGCDTDAIVIALIQFVKVHQALLNILIGRAGLLSQGPILEERDITIGNHVVKRVPKKAFKNEESALIGATIAAALRAVERVVDSTAFTILRLVPTRSECAKQQKEAVDGSLAEAIAAYDEA